MQKMLRYQNYLYVYMDVLYEIIGKWRKNKVKYMKMKRNGNIENNFG